MYKKGKYVLVIGAAVVVLLMVSSTCAVNIIQPNEIKIIDDCNIEELDIDYGSDRIGNGVLIRRPGLVFMKGAGVAFFGGLIVNLAWRPYVIISIHGESSDQASWICGRNPFNSFDDDAFHGYLIGFIGFGSAGDPFHPSENGFLMGYATGAIIWPGHWNE